MATACVVVFIFMTPRSNQPELIFYEKNGALRKMLHTTSLTLNKEFRRAYYRGRSFTTPVVVIYAFKNHNKENRIGLTATKKIGKAVARNRARRILKEAYRLLEQEFPIGFDFVLVARVKTVGSTTPQVMKAMRFALSKMFTEK